MQVMMQTCKLPSSTLQSITRKLQLRILARVANYALVIAVNVCQGCSRNCSKILNVKNRRDKQMKRKRRFLRCLPIYQQNVSKGAVQ